MQRKAPQGKQHEQRHWGEEMLEQREHEEGRDKAGNIGPGQITELLGCSARNLGFVMQSRGVTLFPTPQLSQSNPSGLLPHSLLTPPLEGNGKEAQLI